MLDVYQSLTETGHFRRQLHSSPFSSCLPCYASLHTTFSAIWAKDFNCATQHPVTKTILNASPLLGLPDLHPHRNRQLSLSALTVPHRSALLSQASLLSVVPWKAFLWDKVLSEKPSFLILEATHKQAVLTPCWSLSHTAVGFCLL